MPVDTSSYPTQQQAPINPLQAYLQGLEIQHGQMANQDLQQQLKGRIATGNILSQNQNPDGSTNMNAAMNAIMQDPDARLFALKTQSDLENNNKLTNYTQKNPQTGAYEQRQAPLPNVMGLGNPGQQVPAQPTQDKIDGIHKHLQAVSDTLTPIANNPEASEKDVINGVTDLIAHPDAQFTPQDGAKVLMAIPSGANGAPASSAQIQGMAQKKLADVNNTRAQLTQKYPPTSLSNPRQETPQPGGDTTLPAQQSQLPGSLTSAPMGTDRAVAGAQDNVKKVNDDATIANQSLPVLSNILNLSKGGSKTGTATPKIYQYLVDHGLAPAGVQDSTAQTQLISKYMNQVITGLNPGSDARLEAFESANPNPTQLPETIQQVVPFLQAVAKGKIAKQNYYQANVGLGQDPQREQQASKNWNNAYDPRLIEMNELQKNDPQGLKDYMSKLQPDDLRELKAKHPFANSLGLYNQQ